MNIPRISFATSIVQLLSVAIALFGATAFLILHHEDGDNRVVFSLQDVNGEEVTEQSLWGQWSILTFGFTSCPDICPTHALQVANSIAILEKSKVGHMRHNSKIQGVFVSVDHVRDDAERVDRYVKHFHPNYLGLVGSKAQIDLVVESFGTNYEIKPTTFSSEVAVLHSSLFYLIDPYGRVVKRFPASSSANEIANTIGTYL